MVSQKSAFRQLIDAVQEIECASTYPRMQILSSLDPNSEDHNELNATPMATCCSSGDGETAATLLLLFDCVCVGDVPSANVGTGTMAGGVALVSAAMRNGSAIW